MPPRTDAAHVALAHRGALMAARAARVIELPWGSALSDPSVPHMRDLNIVRVQGPRPDLTQAALAGVVEGLQADLPQRRIEIWDEPTADRLTGPFEGAGWETDGILLMGFDGAPPAADPRVGRATP